MQFNLYMDVLLNLRTFSTAALRMQTDFYATKHDEAGVALDNRVNWSKTDWMLFAAATAMAPGVENEGIRDMFIDDVHGYITNGKNDVPFGDRYVVQDDEVVEAGTWSAYRARPVVGGHFALMALDGAASIGSGGE